MTSVLYLISNVIVLCSTFQMELEKCVDQPQKIGGVFIRYVSLSSKLMMMMMTWWWWWCIFLYHH